MGPYAALSHCRRYISPNASRPRPVRWFGGMPLCPQRGRQPHSYQYRSADPHPEQGAAKGAYTMLAGFGYGRFERRHVHAIHGRGAWTSVDDSESERPHGICHLARELSGHRSISPQVRPAATKQVSMPTEDLANTCSHSWWMRRRPRCPSGSAGRRKKVDYRLQ